MLSVYASSPASATRCSKQTYRKDLLRCSFASRLQFLSLKPGLVYQRSAAATNCTNVEQPTAQDELTALQTLVAAPSKQHQPQLTGKERAALRAYSETLAKDKKLQRLQVGAQGITNNVLMACLDILMKHEYLRVKLGEGCGLERKQTAALLADLLDAVVVGQVGFTITLYRKKGLPRPDNLTKVTG